MSSHCRNSNSRRRLIGAAVVAAAGGALGASVANASPLVRVAMQGKDITQGQSTFQPELFTCNVGDTIVYSILTYLSPTGTTNTNTDPSHPTGHTITAKVDNIDGINSLSVDAFQLMSDQIQMDFKITIPAMPVMTSASSGTTVVPGQAVSLTTGTPGWKNGLGANGGHLHARGNGNNDVVFIRPVQNPGTFRGVTSTSPASLTGTGMFVITSLAGGIGSVRLGYCPTSQGGAGGGFQFNDGTDVLIATDVTEAGPDPYVAYDPLIFGLNDGPPANGPEPGSLTLIGLAAAGLVMRRRPRGQV